MKKTFLAFVLVIASAAITAQVPQVISYQAVVRDAGGNLLSNQLVSFQLSILQGSVTGTVVYCERQQKTTDPYGTVTLGIGGGTVVSGNFSAINWSNASNFLKTELDITGGTNFQFMGTSQFLSAPFSLNSGSVTLTSPDGQLWNLAVGNNGSLSASLVYVQSCPGISSLSYGGQTYHTVQVGNQCWLRENLNIGTMISGSASQTNNSIIEKYCYDNQQANCDIYGGIYQWNEMMQYTTVPGAQGICPAGWHLPTDAEWSTLIMYLGNEDVAGGKMKETGTAHWLTPNAGATNESHFTALPSGYMSGVGNFTQIGEYSPYWTSSESYSTSAYYRLLTYDSPSVSRSFWTKTYGFSSRCLKN